MVIRVRAESLWKPLRKAAADLLILVGAAGVLVWAWGMFGTMLYQHVQKNHFERELIEHPANPARPPARVPGSSGNTGGAVLQPARTEPRLIGLVSPRHWFEPDPLVLGEIEVPRLDMSVIVREGMDDATLSKAAGHVPTTAFPGESGNFVVLGHRDTLFRPLRGLEKGDQVRVRTSNGDYRYRIDSIVVVAPEDVELREATRPTITLVTCFPFDFIGPAPRRFVAHGHLGE